MARNAGLLIARQLFLTGVGITVTAVVARHLGPADYGRYTYAFALVVGFGTLAAFGLRAVTIRTVAQDSQPVDEYVGLMLSLRLVMALAVWPVLMVTAYLLDQDTALLVLVAIASLTLPINALGTTLRDAIQGLERFGIEVLASIVVRVVTMVGALSVVALGYGVTAIVIVYAAGTVFGLLIPLVALRRAGYQLRMRWSAKDAGRELRHAFPFGVSALMALLMWQINPVLIEALSTVAMVGIFAAGARLLGPLEMIPDSVSDALTPAVAKAWVQDGAEEAGEIVGRAFYGLLVIALPIAVGGALCADELVLLLFGDGYQEAGAVLAILALILPTEFVSIPANDALGAIHQQNRVVLLTSIGAVVNVGVAVVLIPSHGAVGCALATACASVVFCVTCLLLLGRHLRIWTDPRAYAKLIAANALMAPAVYFTLPYGVLLAIPVGGVVFCAVAVGSGAVSPRSLLALFRPARATQGGSA